MQDMLLKFLACRDVGAVLIEEFKGLKLYWVGVAAAGGCYLMQVRGGWKPPFHGLRYVFRSISVHLSEFVFVESMEGKVPLLGSELYRRFKEMR